MSKLRQDADAIIQAAITAAQPDEAVRKALEGRDFGSGRVVLYYTLKTLPQILLV